MRYRRRLHARYSLRICRIPAVIHLVTSGCSCSDREYELKRAAGIPMTNAAAITLVLFLLLSRSHAVQFSFGALFLRDGCFSFSAHCWLSQPTTNQYDEYIYIYICISFRVRVDQVLLIHCGAIFGRIHKKNTKLQYKRVKSTAESSKIVLALST